MTEQEATEVPSITFNEAVGLVEVRNVNALELHAARRDVDLPDFPLPDDDEEPLPLTFQLYFQDSPELIAVRARGEFQNSKVRAIVDAAVAFDKKQPFQLGAEAQANFIRRLGLIALYPYIRMYVQDLATKLGAPLTPGLLHINQELVVEEITPTDSE